MDEWLVKWGDQQQLFMWLRI